MKILKRMISREYYEHMKSRKWMELFKDNKVEVATAKRSIICKSSNES